jgi:hypothetical protein
MTVASVNQYRVGAGQRDAFLSAVRETFALAGSLGAATALRTTLVGGEMSGLQSAIFWFANAVARGEYLDAVTRPEHVSKHALTLLTRAGGVTLIGRSFLDELSPGTAPPEQPPVLATVRVQVTPAREAEADEALRQAVELRGNLGIEAHAYAAQYSGAATGFRFLAIHASSHKQLAEDAARVVAWRQQTGGLGPIPRAVASGAMIMTGSTISTLVAL